MACFVCDVWCIQLFQKRLSQSMVDTGTERSCGVQAAQIFYYRSNDLAKYLMQVLHLCHSHTVTTFTGASSLIMTVPRVPFGSSIDY